MSIYALGATNDGRVTESHRSVLQSKLGSSDPVGLQFHGDQDAVFQPENCSAVLIAGGNITADPRDLEHVLRYPQALGWFSESTIGISLEVSGDFDHVKWEHRISAIDSLKTLTVRNAESAQILRQAGIRTPVLVCADLAYLQRVKPHITGKPARKPVLGIVTNSAGDIRLDTLRDLDSDFEVRHVSPSTFDTVDVCLTTEPQGVVLSVLHEIPFATIRSLGKTPERECRALGYPEISDVRDAWSARVALQELIQKAKRGRLRLAQRNIEVMQNALARSPEKKNVIEKGKHTLLVWAAPEEFWGEAQRLLASIGSGFDCLVPSGSSFVPARSRRQMAVPPGTLMHWAMFPDDLKQRIENQYDDTIVCHAFSGPRQQLADIARRTGRRGWEYRLWTHSCESFS